MKKLILASIITVGLGSALVYANQAAMELEHANKTAASADGVSGDMSAMKAAGKCNADQSGKKKTIIKRVERKKTKAELEIEHANRLLSSEDGYTKGMGNMKAQGKCNTSPTGKTKIKEHNPSVDELEIEYTEIRTIAEYNDGF